MQRTEMKVRTADIVIGVLLLAACSISLFAQQPGLRATASVTALAPPYKTASYVYVKPQEATAPFFSHGYVVQFRHLSTSIGPNIYLYNSSGALEHEVAAWPKQAASFNLSSVDVGSSHQLVFSGRAAMEDGSRLNFIATSDLDGKHPTYFETGNYLATRIAQAADGSIWTVGEAFPRSSGAPRSWDNYDMLRHYSPSGALLEHFLPRWGSDAAYVVQQVDAAGNVTNRAYEAYDKHNTLLAVYTPPLWGPRGGYARNSSALSQTWLTAVNDGIVLYDGGEGTLYRYSTLHPVLTALDVDMHYNETTRINGFAAGSDGRIYATLQPKVENGDKNRSLGLSELVIAPSGDRAVWSQVPPGNRGKKTSEAVTRVLGSDGVAVVYKTTKGRVYWANLKGSQAEH
jgi:hypothetical protein